MEFMPGAGHRHLLQHGGSRPQIAFPIDFSSGKHAEQYSAPGTVESYSKELATRLDACRKVAMLLVKEQRCWHCELINSC